MQSNWKRLLSIFLFILAVSLFAFMIYWFFLRPYLTPQPELEPPQPVPGQLPTTVTIDGRIYLLDEEGRLPTGQTLKDLTTEPFVPAQPVTDTAQGGLTKTTLVTSDPTPFATLDRTGNFIYYNEADGRFYQINTGGDTTPLDNKVFYQVQNVTWSNNKDKAVLEYPDGSKTLYDFTTQEQISLPSHWQDFGFSTNDSQIGFKNMALDVENRYLAVAQINGSEIRIIERIGSREDRFDVNWSPGNQIIATYTTPKDFDRSDVYFLGLNDENFKLMTVDGMGFEGQWTPDGQQMVYSVYNSRNDYKPELWVADATPGNIGNNRRKLNVETWADKCVITSNSTMYCAVPTSLPYGAGFEPDSTEVALLNDQIYEVDFNTGTRRLIAVPDGEHNINQLMYNQQTNQLIFYDDNERRSYRIDL